MPELETVHTIGLARGGTRLVTHSDPTLLTPARAEYLMGCVWFEHLFHAHPAAVLVVEFDERGFWWPGAPNEQVHPWSEADA